MPCHARGVFVVVVIESCPECGARVDLVTGPGCGVEVPVFTVEGREARRSSDRPIYTCPACEWAKEAN